jgi:predicted GNAT family acetyltransferase
MSNLQFLEFKTPGELFNYNREFIYHSYYEHFYLIKIIEQLESGQHDIINGYNIVGGDGDRILCLHIDGAYLLYSHKWNRDMLELLSAQVDLKICTEGFSFSGNKELIMELFNHQSSNYEIFKDRIIYECLTVQNAPTSIEGDWELCTFRDFKKVSMMIYEYHVEEYGDKAFRDYQSVKKMIEGVIRNESCFLWKNGKSICCVGQLFNEETGYPLIGTLYTDKAHRNKGYATALVHALTESVIDDGLERCGLVSDATNPSSNKVFQKVGYKPIYNYVSMHTLNPSKFKNA